MWFIEKMWKKGVYDNVVENKIEKMYEKMIWVQQLPRNHLSIVIGEVTRETKREGG